MSNMNGTIGVILVATVLMGCMTATPALGQLTSADAAAYRRQVMANPHLASLDGEAFTWHARSGIGRFFTAYHATEDAAWLTEAATYMDWLVSKMEAEPDGYKGWVGSKMGSDGTYRGPHVVGDANLIEPMLQFAEIVKSDNALTERFGAKADEYIALARHVVEKWDKRGSYEVDGDYAVYTQQDQWVRAEAPGQFVTVPQFKFTENMNKSGKMGVLLLRLHAVTGEPEWRDRAVKLFNQYKRIMRYKETEDRYVFNFWEPFGPWDLDPDTGDPLGWINVHPFRAGYQVAEVGMMAQAYHRGIVFDQQDMQRLVRTNLWMWNQDRDNIRFKASDGRSNAGQLWSALAAFDPTIRDLQQRGMPQGDSIANRIDRLHFENVTSKRPVGYERQYVTDPAQVRVTDIPHRNSKELNYAAVIPGRLKPGGGRSITLGTQVRGKGTLQVDLVQGDRHVGRLLEKQVDGTESFDGRAGFESLLWDGQIDGESVAAGAYTVRWTLNESSRERGLIIE